MRKIVFDIETSNVFEDTGSADPASLSVAVVGIFDSLSNSYRCYEQRELPELWPVIESADLLIGFNSEHFDIPILNKYYRGDLRKIRSIDILKEVKAVLGKRLKLSTLAEATLGRKKTGHGLESIRWWNEGQKDKVKQYCLDDVKITKDLYDYIKNNGKCMYKDGKDIKEIAIDSSKWEMFPEKARTGSLF